ncbi:SRPBCC family protein [Mesorhizobium shangrilense]|uniref:SRPBCC domain-containing protein n=1 Tax=Mesorhizobium shangrilense TaxID=460060 RepID=A0ABV2D5W8_9HYPH
MSAHEPMEAAADRSFAIERTFNAPVERVFRLWTDPLLVAQWWGIKDCTIPHCALDVSVGGRWRIDMRTLSGALYRNQGSYLEVVENERLSYSDEPDPEIREWAGKPPGQSRHTVTFTPDGKRTHVHFEVTLASSADRERLLALGMRGGWMQSFYRLEELIEGTHHAD